MHTKYVHLFHSDIWQLEMERALLEGEHQTEMGQLQSDQEKINQLKEKQNMLIEKATREREKVCNESDTREFIHFICLFFFWNLLVLLAREVL